MESTITLKKISSLSGFSVSTVSKALNNKLDISKKTRKTIQCIAQQYNYIPNSYAVALRKKRTKSIAVIIPRINELCYSNFLYNLQVIASEFDYRIVLFQSFHDKSKELEYLKSVNDGSVDGIIMLSKNELVNTYLNTIPLEIMKISSNKSEDIIEGDYICSFNTLLQKVN